MIDYDEYNDRRDQLIFCFEDDPYDFIAILLDSGKVTIRDLIDTLDWEDNEALNRLMGWDFEASLNDSKET